MESNVLSVEPEEMVQRIGGSEKTIMNRSLCLLLAFLCLGTGCESLSKQSANSSHVNPPSAGIQADDQVEITILHLNDVYELTPVSGSREGGLARVASLLKRLKRENPNTISVLAGDLFSPSALGTAEIDGVRLGGAQMVATLNAMKWDYMTFGNHEFDLTESEFHARLDEIRFTVLTSNVFDSGKARIPNTVGPQVLSYPNPDGPPIKLALVGITMDGLSSDYVRIQPPTETANSVVAKLRPDVDVLILVTHLPLEQDIEIAQKVSGVDLIVGGHEHENIKVLRGQRFVPICKADANARSAYIHRIRVDPKTRKASISSELKLITSDLGDDPTTAKVINSWMTRGFGAFQVDGFEPKQKVAETSKPLDGLETSVRNHPTGLTRLLADAMLRSFPGSELSLFNSGSIRIDDFLYPGAITQYDVLRILPFGGTVKPVSMSGALLRATLDQGEKNRGGGGYLQHANIERRNETWYVGSTALSEKRNYRVAINDFLLSGQEEGLERLKPRANDDQIRILDGRPVDIRSALIQEMKRVFEPQ